MRSSVPASTVSLCFTPAKMEHLLTNARIARWLHQGILLAVSGGADSTAMLRFFLEMKKNAAPDSSIAVAHINHGLRSMESDDDADFVEKLASRFGLPFFSTKITPESWENDDSGSFEAAARNLRYNFLVSTAQTNGLRHIALAHTRNDQAETIMHRIIRGTGIAGLSGIPEVRKINDAVSLVRPFLRTERKKILEYLAALGQDFRHDSSNDTTRWTRNKIRLEILPAIRKSINPSVDDSLVRLGMQASELHGIIDDMLDSLYEDIVTESDLNSAVVECTRIKTLPEYITRALLLRIWKTKNWPLRHVGHEHWCQVAAMLRETNHASKTVSLPGGIIIRIDAGSQTMTIEKGVS